MLEKFEQHFQGQKRPVFCRYQFWSHRRTEQQPFNDYLTQLQTLADQCDFTEKDNMIRDKIIFSTDNVHEKRLKERLSENLTLTKTRDLCVAYEVTQNEVKTMATNPSDISAPQKQIQPITKKKTRKPPHVPSTQQHQSQGGRSSKKKWCWHTDQSKQAMLPMRHCTSAS